MSIFFPLKDELHNVEVKFSQACLPDAKKPYNLKPACQKELDIRAVAAKASVYKVNIPPNIIMEGFNAAMELMFYLTADGYKVKTPYFTMGLKVPGEYDGTETTLPEDVVAELRLRTSSSAKKFIRENVAFSIDGSIENEGKISHAVDEATGLTDVTATRGNVLTIKGNGLKIEAEADRKNLAGVYFLPETGTPIKAVAIAVNQPRTLKVIIPTTLTEGVSYSLVVETQSSARSSHHLLKEMRDIRSSFTVTAQ